MTITAREVAAGAPRLADDLQALFDEAARRIQGGDALGAFRRLSQPLSALWTEARSIGCADAVREQAKAHRLYALLAQDPYTERARSKPRGYAGDAVMLDHVYSGIAPPGTSAIGRGVFACTTRSGMGLSVLYRRVLLRSLIDEVVASVEHGRILSVASGHCRELSGSLVQTAAFGGEFVALDQDGESCTRVAQDQAGHRVRVVHEGVRELLARPDSRLGHFDLVYSAGLYDYLPEALARRLTQRLFSLLRPGGRLLIANFMPGGSGRGYMELFMDWPLICRDAAELAALVGGCSGAQVAGFVDPHRNVVYAEIGKVGGHDG